MNGGAQKTRSKFCVLHVDVSSSSPFLRCEYVRLPLVVVSVVGLPETPEYRGRDFFHRDINSIPEETSENQKL